MKNKKVNYIIIGICLVIMLVTLFLTDSPENLWNALCTANPLWLLCGLGCMLAYWLLETRALFLVIDGLRKVSQSNGRRLKPTECLRVSMVGQLFNCITPFASGGQPMQAYMLSKYGQSVGTASSALLARFIVYQFVLTVYSVVVLVFKFTFFLEQVSGFVTMIIIGFVINTIVMVFLIAIGFFPKPTTKLLLALPGFLHKIHLCRRPGKLHRRITKELDSFYTDFHAIRHNMRILIRPAIDSAIQLTAYFSVAFFVCLSLQNSQGVDWFTIISAAAFVLMFSSFIPLPGGSGGAELSFYGLFFIFFPGDTASVGIALLLWRFFTFYLPMIVGMLMMYLDPDSKQAKKHMEQVEEEQQLQDALEEQRQVNQK